MGFFIWTAVRAVASAGDNLALRWTILGAMGSWAGSIFGAIALVISLFSLWLPQKIKLKVVISTGMMISQIPGIDKIDAYVITVKNVGMRSVMINNIYLNFGGKKRSDIYVGMLNQGSLLQAYTINFPQRLEQGEAFDYYLLKDKLEAGLAQYEGKMPLETPLYIRISEVTKGNQYLKTAWTLKNFIRQS